MFAYPAGQYDDFTLDVLEEMRTAFLFQSLRLSAKLFCTRTVPFLGGLAGLHELPSHRRRNTLLPPKDKGAFTDAPSTTFLARGLTFSYGSHV